VTDDKTIAVSLEFQFISRPHAHIEANLAWQGDPSSAKHSGLYLQMRAFRPHFFHVVYSGLN
jgi:hypothetical protein